MLVKGDGFGDGGKAGSDCGKNVKGRQTHQHRQAESNQCKEECRAEDDDNVRSLGFMISAGVS